jgi:benzodiazapine receptor
MSSQLLKKLGKYGGLLGSIVVCQAVGGLGGIWTAKDVREWYPTLEKPSFNPPNWLFGPVWSLLYALMGASAWLTWRHADERAVKHAALQLFSIQFALNSLWSFIFFRLHSPRWAFFEIVMLWGAIGMTLVAIWKINRLAGMLFLPYLLWTSFAVLLNFRIWRLNPEQH